MKNLTRQIQTFRKELPEILSRQPLEHCIANKKIRPRMGALHLQMNKFGTLRGAQRPKMLTNKKETFLSLSLIC